MTKTHLDIAVDLARLFEQLGLRYAIGGAFASSLVGEPRSTVDIDIALELKQDQLEPLLERVRPSFYVPEAEARRATQEHDCFNIIHNDAALKVDLFVLGSGTLDVNQIERRMQVEVPTDPPALLWITSTEDQVLRKLDWYHRGDHVSERQWHDVVAILRINRPWLDTAYLKSTADGLGLDLLLHSAQLAARI